MLEEMGKLWREERESTEGERTQVADRKVERQEGQKGRGNDHEGGLL